MRKYLIMLVLFLVGCKEWGDISYGDLCPLWMREASEECDLRPYLGKDSQKVSVSLLGWEKVHVLVQTNDFSIINARNVSFFSTHGETMAIENVSFDAGQEFYVVAMNNGLAPSFDIAPTDPDLLIDVNIMFARASTATPTATTVPTFTATPITQTTVP